MELYIRSFLLLFALLNPFLLSIYLIDLIHDLDAKVFARVLARGSLIATTVFALFAWGGDAIFSRYLQVNFASFQVFGGIIFLIIGLRFVFEGVQAVRGLRGQPEHIAGSIAMPFLIGPGTLSASVVVGARHPVTGAIAVIVLTMVTSVLMILGLKLLHDRLRGRHARLTDRYIELVGRISALLVGTFAVEMIMRGVLTWIATGNGHP